MNVNKNSENGLKNGASTSKPRKNNGLLLGSQASEAKKSAAAQERDDAVTPPGVIAEIYLAAMAALGTSSVCRHTINLRILSTPELERLENLISIVQPQSSSITDLELLGADEILELESLIAKAIVAPKVYEATRN